MQTIRTQKILKKSLHRLLCSNGTPEWRNGRRKRYDLKSFFIVTIARISLTGVGGDKWKKYNAGSIPASGTNFLTNKQNYYGTRSNQTKKKIQTES